MRNQHIRRSLYQLALEGFGKTVSGDWKPTALWVLSAILITAGVFFQSVIGIDLSTILVLPGMVSLMAYLTMKGLVRQDPRYVLSRKGLVLGLWITVAGSIVVLIAELPVVLSISRSVDITLKATGVAIFIAGIIAYVVSLRRGHSQA
jgi:hypothetical protein